MLRPPVVALAWSLVVPLLLACGDYPGPDEPDGTPPMVGDEAGGAGGQAGAGASGGGPIGAAGAAVVCFAPGSITTPRVPEAIVPFKGADGATRGMSATEITRWQYSQYLEATAGAPASDDPTCDPRGPLDTNADELACNGNLPALVTFCSAKGYCEANGRTLCGAETWTFVCSNGGTTRFPYGDQKTDACGANVVHEAGALPGCRGQSPPFDDIYDLSGNAPEWTDDCALTEAWDGGGGKGAAGMGSSMAPRLACRVRGASPSAQIPATDCEARNDPATGFDRLSTQARAGFRCCVEPTCVPGATLACYSGPPETRGVGNCVAGTRTCLPDGSAYGPCLGEVLPTAESCGGEGDESCDGAVNEGGPDCTCTPGEARPCYGSAPATKDVGLCRGGVQLCNAAGTGFDACIGEVRPTAERCPNEGDEDCDGSINEPPGEGCLCVPGASEACYDGPPGTSAEGVCSRGSHVCSPGGDGWGACEAQTLPVTEMLANDLDDDCDGFVDERGPGEADAATLSFVETFESNDGTMSVLGRDPVGGGVLLSLNGYANVTRGGLPWLSASSKKANATLASFTAAGALAWTTELVSHRILAYQPLPDGYLFAAAVRGDGANEDTIRLFQLAADHTSVWQTDLVAAPGVAPEAALTRLPDGGIVAALSFQGTMNVAGQAFESWPRGLLLVGLSSGGAPLWARRIDGLEPYGTGPRFLLRSGSNGELWLAVMGRDAVDFGAGPVPTEMDAVDVCVARLTATGQPLHARCLGQGATLQLRTLTVGAGGHAFVGGSLGSTLDVGLGKIRPRADVPFANNGFLVELDAFATPVSSRWIRTPVAFVAKPGGFLVADDRAVTTLSTTLSPVATYLPSFVASSPITSIAPDDGDGFFFAGPYQPGAPTDVGTGPLPVSEQRSFVLGRVVAP